MERQCIVLSANRGYALLNSRTSIIGRFIDEGWQVVLATAEDDESRQLADCGAVLEPVEFRRTGFSPFVDLSAYRRLKKIFGRYRPRLVQNFHAKPIILGSMAARGVLGRSTGVVNTITGLGQTLAAGGLTSRLASVGFRMALRRGDITIFQNDDDRCCLLEQGWLSAEKARLIVSSGVDLRRFEFVDRGRREAQIPVVVMVARLLKQKGVPEFVDLARNINRNGVVARFVIAGEEEPWHPDAVSLKWLREQDSVEYRGRLADIRSLLNEADLLVFPSYYREGVPRVILEASATGLPTVAFDVPGVREVVLDGKTGYLVSQHHKEELTARTVMLLDDSVARRRLGTQAREFVENNFSTPLVDRKYLDIYRELGATI